MDTEMSNSRLAQDLGSGRAKTRWAVTAVKPQTTMNNVCSNILQIRIKVILSNQDSSEKTV